MGKRQKQKRERNQDSLSSEELLSLARQHLANGKFRKARDAAKILFKHDAELGRPLLVEANQSLAEEMFAKGQDSEAQTVLNYLQSIATPEELSAMNRRTARAAGDWSTVAQDALASLQEASKEPVNDQMRRWADEAVVAFAPDAEGPFADDLRAIQSALEAVSDGRWDEARTELRKVSRRSPFAHWTGFIKGLAAFYNGKRKRARELFEALPPGSVTAKAAAGWLKLLAEPGHDDGNASPATINFWCQLAEEPRLGPALVEAEENWQAGKIGVAYETLKRNIAFPALGNTIPGQLSRLFFSAAFILPGGAVDDWLSYIDRRLMDKRGPGPLDREEFFRTFLCHEGPRLGDQLLSDDVWGYLVARKSRCGEDPQFDAFVRTWVGKIFAEPYGNPMFGNPTLRNAEWAIVNLEQATQLAPDAVEPCLALCEVYDATRQKSERNRLLDRITQQFPRHKETLLLAGRHALERKVYRKAMAFFQQAHEADPLDSHPIERLAEAACGQLRQHYEKKNFKKAHALWDKQLWPLADDSESPWRSRWSLLTRRAILAGIHESSEIGRDWLQQAQDAAPGAGLVWLARLLFHEELTSGAKKQRLPKKELKLPNDPAPSLANLAAMLELWNRYEDDGRLGRSSYRVSNTIAAWLSKYLTGALKRPFERGITARVFEGFHANYEGFDLAAKFAKALLRQDRGDPLYQLFQLRADQLTNYGLDVTNDLRRLDKIEAAARKRNDHNTLLLIDQERVAIKSSSAPPPPPLFGDDVDFGAANDPDYYRPDDFPGPPPFDSSMDDLGSLGMVLDQLANAPDEVIEELRKTRPKEMPAAVFDELVAAAREKNTGGLPFPAPDSKPNPPGKRPPKTDPNQLDFF